MTRTDIFFKDFRAWCDKYEMRQANYISLAVFRLFISKPQEDICKLCADFYYNGTVNTAPHNLCEGVKCEEVGELVKEDLLNDLK